MGLIGRIRAARLAFAHQPTDALGLPAESYMPLWVSDDYALPAIDDLINSKGLAVYREMMERDDQVQACISLLTYARLSSGWTLTKGGEDPVDEKVLAFVMRCFDDLQDSSVTRLLADTMEALPMGFACVEKIMGEPYTDGDLRGLQPYRTFRTLPQETITFKRDALGELEPDGIWQAKNRQMVAGSQDPSFFTKLPRERFILWSWRQKWGSPLGMSILRPAYRWYFLKDQLVRWWARYVEKFGMPFLSGEVPKGTGAEEKARILQLLFRFHTQKAAVLEAGTKINMQEISSNQVTNFDTLLAKCDRGIARSIFTPATLFDQPDVGAYSLGQSQRGMYDWVLSNIGEHLQDEVMRDQVIRPLVRWNFGENVKLPTFKFNDYSEPNRLLIAQMLKVAVDMGVPIPTRVIRELLNIEAPMEDEEVVGPVENPNQGLPPGTVDQGNEIDNMLKEMLKPKGPEAQVADALRTTMQQAGAGK